VSGDSKYLDRAAQAIKSFQTYCTVPTGGYAGIQDVDDNGSSGQPRARVDETESFWFAEVLKYLYVELFKLLGSIEIDFFCFVC
jgi:mannosyl-oligosaccharide alpha-1,2-mannosidase